MDNLDSLDVTIVEAVTLVPHYANILSSETAAEITSVPWKIFQN